MENRTLEHINWKQEFSDVPECVHAAVLRANEMILQKERSKVRRMPVKRILILTACITLLSGMTVLASSLWQQRMEAMNQAEVEAYFLNISQSNAPAFRYSRPMSASEKELFTQLNLAYEEGGIFPEGCVNILSEEETYRGKDVSYDIVSGTFFLPETLDEEALLQIIDFYHKADYAVQKVAAQVEAGETEVPKPEAVTETVKEPVVMQGFEKLNEAVEYYQFMVPSEEFVQKVATGTEYMYLGEKQEILRLPLGEETSESIYTLPDNQTLFGLDADKEDNLYVSIREFVPDKDAYVNRIVKLNADGEELVRYQTESLGDAMAIKMLPAQDGKLYVKTMWAEGLLLYVFDEQGEFVETIADDNVIMHPAGSMCFGEDGMLYALGQDVIAKVDLGSKKVAETYDYVMPEMIAAVDLLCPMDENRFYLFSYDGIFVTTWGEADGKRILAPHESDVFAEGCKRYAVSDDMIVTVNYMQPDLKITYLKLTD